MRILLGLNEIANVLQNLKKGFDELGIQNDIVLLEDYPFGVSESLVIKNWNISFVKYAIKKYRQYKTHIILKYVFSSVFFLARLMLFVRCLYVYDVFIMVAYSRFFGYRELPILKFFRKKVIFYVVGSDFRPPYLNGSFYGKSMQEIYLLTKETKYRVEMLEKYATYIISYNAVAHFQTKSFIDYRYIGIATDCGDIKNICIPNEYHKKRSIKIVHAPTNKIAKGSEVIIREVNKLKGKYDIEFILLSDMKNAEVLYHVATCDFVVDQLYSGGGYMARFGTEAAFFKKPVIITSYNMGEFYENFPYQEKIPPVVSGRPDEVGELIVKLIENEEYRKKIGESAYQFVTNEWSPKSVAKCFLRLIYDDIPKEWWLDPLDNHVLWSYGKAIENVKKDLQSYILTFGIPSLMVEHNPLIKECMLKEAGLQDMYAKSYKTN
ncbi:hypothetical protein LS70_007555 [Helicobacter sp. MIT 11-5569]|uniref:hypothetical protein n=1 Tax=Helicobacter sp. MIT 11-5569 TaxID=1548151 RepID=UPI00051FE4C6|nr:hypothetical protein [Helicobacter sp. MIT 11-5569]TLD81361.1 hypothetical protein LS70_007555 [Helicobacter sp. MIT 11-5569]